ncbi:MAG: hypothetical protein J6M08_08365 [Methanobrevibacter sp.]|nr:hypothetical protein [Methanobrevibacter sp.]
MKTIALIIMVAIVLEALVEYVKTIDSMVVSRAYKTAITQGITIILGIGLAFVFHLQLFNGAMSEIYEGLKINPTVDMILTGILFSRGSNYFSDLISKLQKPSTVELSGTELVGEPLPDEDEEDMEESPMTWEEELEEIKEDEE